MRDGKNHGRPPRLSGYDYSQNGCYFVTFCTKNRAPCLSRIQSTGYVDVPNAVVGRGLAPGMVPEIMLELTRIGTILEQQIMDLERRFRLRVDHHIIMPNHCHLLITLPGASPRPTLSEIIGTCKSITTRLANQSDGMRDGNYFSRPIMTTSYAPRRIIWTTGPT